MRKKTYLAYFDVLGFKEIVGKRLLTEVEDFFEKLLINTESVATNKRSECRKPLEYCADLNNSDLNCLHISDSIIFWTNSDTNDDLNLILDRCAKLVQNTTIPCKLLRGCLTYGEISYNFCQSKGEASFLDYSIIGSTIVEAYTKAESLKLTGCIVDKKIIKKLGQESFTKKIEDGIIAQRIVNTKFGNNLEYMFVPVKIGYTELGFENDIKNLKRAYEYASKCPISNMPDEVRQKFNNTIEFYRSFLNPNIKTTKDLQS